MTDVQQRCSLNMDDFVSSGRTGRRNALPDVLEATTAASGIGGLSYEMEKLKCSDHFQRLFDENKISPSPHTCSTPTTESEANKSDQASAAAPSSGEKMDTGQGT